MSEYKPSNEQLSDEATLAYIKLEVLKCALGIKSLDERALFNRLEKLWLDAFEAGVASVERGVDGHG